MISQDGFGYYDFISADVTTTSLTAVDIPKMTFPLLGASGIYTFKFMLKIGSSTTGGVAFALSVTGGAAFQAWAVGSSTGLNVLAVDSMTQSGVLGVAFATVPAQNLFLSIEGGLRNGTFAGALQLQAAKVVGGTATLSAGSYFEAKQL